MNVPKTTHHRKARGRWMRSSALLTGAILVVTSGGLAQADPTGSTPSGCRKPTGTGADAQVLPLHTEAEAKKCLEDSGFVLNDRESVWGYPMGQWSDENGKLKEITAQRVNEKFKPSEVMEEILKVQEKVADGASQDERKNAKPFFQDPTRNPDTGANQGEVVFDQQGSEKAKALGFDPGVAGYLDVRDKNTQDKEPWFDGMNAKQVCEMPTHPTETPRKFPGLRCGFVGKLDEAYPSLVQLPAGVGYKSSKVKYEAKVGREEAKKTEWNVGGKITATLTPPGETGGFGPGVEGNFQYSEATTTTKKWERTVSDEETVNIPGDDKAGWIEARANGAWYIGYIVYQIYDATPGKGLKTVLIPARVLIQGHGKDEDKPEATGQTIPSTTWLGRKN
ncbi:hypothetical protein [Streptomyces sioyaensis]|uniref:hypothetical protein n=1 Tax=Streptomyces sioyaensis TaxID=67364 RepID=UPI0037BCCAD6